MITKIERRDTPITTIVLALISAIVPTITALAGLIVTLEVRTKTAENKAVIDQVHIQTNSMKDALVAAAQKDGIQQGKEIEKTREDTSKADQAKGASDQKLKSK